MAARDNLSKLFPVLLDDTTTDENLLERLEEFMGTIRPPAFPVKQETIRIGSDIFPWESLTTDLVGFEFGDVVLDVNENCLHRVIARDKEDHMWVASKITCGAIIRTSPGTIKRYAPDDAALCDRLASILSDDALCDRLASILSDDDGDLADRVRAEIEKIPQFPVAQNGLQIVGKTFVWDEMTVNLAARGLAFGDVVVDKTRNRLHRVVAYKDDNLWITSAKTENDIVWDPNPDQFEKYQA